MQAAQESFSQAGEIQDLTTLKADFVTNGYILRLFQAPFAPTNLTTEAAFVSNECNFTGYASVSLGGAGKLFVGPAIDSQNNVVLISFPVTMVATDAVSPNTVGGFWIEDTALAVRRFCIFPTPVDMTEALTFIEVTIFENMRGNGYATIDN
jgi:hypothetical protein